jgi:hypothetical protein
MFQFCSQGNFQHKQRLNGLQRALPAVAERGPSKNRLPPTGGVFSTGRVGGGSDIFAVRVNYRWGGLIIPKYW